MKSGLNPMISESGRKSFTFNYFRRKEFIKIKKSVLPPAGIERNRTGVNNNGNTLLSFIQNNDLIMVKNKEVCAGTFTRITQHSSAILDYVLVSQNMKDDVLRMGIDTKVELL